MEKKNVQDKLHKEKQGGFTLIELLVALAILGIVAVPLLSSFVTSARVNADAKDKQGALMVAQNRVEALKADDGTRLQDIFSMDQADDQQTTYSHVSEETVDGQVYTAIETLERDDTWNEQELIDIASIDKNSAGVYVQDHEQDATYATQLRGESNFATERYSGIRRDMVITIEEKWKSATVSVATTYTHTASGQSLSAPTIDIYTGDKDRLQKIYLFYQPLYNSTQRDIREVYTIYNRDLVPVDIYLVCQNPDTDKASDYLMQVRCAEKNRSEAMKEKPYRAITKVHTNLDADRQMLMKKEKDDRVGQVWFQYLAIPDSVTLGESSWANANRYEEETAADILHYSDLSNKSAKDHVYQVKVEVYKGHENDHEEKCLATLKATVETE